MKLAQNSGNATQGTQNVSKQTEISPKRKKASSKNVARKKARHEEIEFDD